MKIFIGYDAREDLVYRTCVKSVNKAYLEAEVIPIVQDQLRAAGIYNRSKDRSSTDFSLTRFLVPYLMNYSGWALFMDCDVIVTRPLVQPKIDGSKAVYVVKHAYQPRFNMKMDGQKNESYHRKNWSSVMFFNCSHAACGILTPAIVNKSLPSWLHQFAWCSDDEIGELDQTNNFLVGEYPAPDKDAESLIIPTDNTPRVLHFTNGVGPFNSQGIQDYEALWFNISKRCES